MSKIPLAYLSLLPHLKNLRYGGVFLIGSENPKYLRALHTIFRRVVMALALLYDLQQVLKVYHERSDTNKAMATMFLLLTHMNSFYKQFIFTKREDKIVVLLDMLKEPIFNQDTPRHIEIQKDHIRRAHIVVKGFYRVAFCTTVIWALYPIVMYQRGTYIEFSIWLPYDASLTRNFYITMMYTWIQTSWLAVLNTTMDSFMAHIMAQAKVQFTILRYDIENVVNNSLEEAEATSTPFNDIFERRFRHILKHYDEILRLCKKFQDIFDGNLLVQFLSSGWIICTGAYRTLDLKPGSVDFMSMLMYLWCMLVEIFLLCYYGNEVNLESENLVQSTFSMNWMDLPMKQQRRVVIFMERIKRPFQPLAGSFIPLSNATFISVLRSSYSFYTFLKRT